MSETRLSGADPRDQDIAEMIEIGVIPFSLAGEPVETGTRMQVAYDYAWQRMYEVAFPLDGPEPATAREKILESFQNLWGMKNDPVNFKRATFASVCLFRRDSIPMIFEGSGSYYELEFARRLESTCREGEIRGEENLPEDLAQHLIAYAATVFTTWLVLEDQAREIDASAAQLGIKNILDGSSILDN